MSQQDLFGTSGGVAIEGLQYEADFLSASEESVLLNAVAALPLREAEYKQYRARRRVQSYGGRFDYNTNELHEAEPIAAFLHPLLERVALWTCREPGDFTQALIAEYRPGTQLGWHRDVPNFELVVGVSLAGSGTLRFRRFPPVKGERFVDLELAPRSIYRLQGTARWDWQHSVPPVKTHRYSITFRTLRIPGSPGVNR